MTKKTRNILVLSGVIVILSLIMLAVAPVFAQTGSGGSTVTLQSGDTLGTVVARYKLSGASLRAFFSQNQVLVVAPGQTVTYPAGVKVNIPGSSASTTYTTKAGDSLGALLGYMGFSASAANAAATPTSAATAAATATEAATPTAAATAAGAAGAPTDNQLQDFVNLNPGLAFTAGQSISLPPGITVIGNNSSSSGTSAGTTTYTVQAGDTLQSIAKKFGITVDQLLALNPNLLTAGMTLNVPSGTGSIPQTGSNQSQTFAVQNEETLGQIEQRFGLGTSQMTQFFTANCNLTVVAGQTVLFPIAITAQGSSGGQQFTYVTKKGDTLCTLVNMMGLNLTAGAASSSSGTSNTAAATATPAATAAATATTAATTAATPTAAATTAATPTNAATTAATPTGAATSAATATGAATSAATPTGAATAAATATGAATSAATPTTAATTAATPTTAATTAATAVATATEAATPTTAATTAATPTATTASSSNTTTTGNTAANPYANNQNGLLREFLKYNRNLKLENGQSVSLSNTIPATGGSTSSSTSSNTTSNTTNASNAAAAAVNPANSNAVNCNIPEGRGLYRMTSSDTIFSVAQRFGVTVEQIVTMNPGRTSYGKGDVIVMPGVEAPGLWNMTALGCNDAANPQPNTTSR